MTHLLQGVSTDRPARAPAVRPGVQPRNEVLTVTVCPAPPGAVVLAVRGEVDMSTSSLLRGHLHEHLRPTCPRLVVDLTEVGFFGAAGLTVLVTVREAAEAAGVSLCLIAGTRAVQRPLTITGLADVFDVCPDIAHAMLRLGDAAAEIIDGSLDVGGVLPAPRAGPGAPPQA